MEQRHHSRRPSLYAAIKLARLVQHFRERLKARVRSRAQRDALSDSESIDLAQFESRANAQRQPKEGDHPRHSPPMHRKDIKCDDSKWLSLLRRVDRRLSIASAFDPLDNAARDDRQLLQFDAQRFVSSQKIKQASNVLDNTTLLLERVHILQVDEARRQQAAARYGFKDAIDFEKYLANIEHLLRCLQQAAYQALIQHSLEALQSDYSHWDKYMERLRGFCDDWYSEWSSGRPPLNSTMPWNIKPSLVVLWGVCWMFYMPNGAVTGPDQPREQAWMAQPWPQGAANMQALGYSTNPAMVPPSNNRSQIISHPSSTGRSPPGLGAGGLGARLGNTVGPGTTGSEMIGSLPTRAYAGPEMTHSGHVTTSFGAQVGQQQAFTTQHQQTPRQPEPLLQKLATTHTTPVTTVQTSISDAPFATPTSSIWSPTPTHTHTQDQAYVTHNANLWQQPNFGDDISSKGLYHHHSDPSVNPYAEQQLDSISTATSSQNIYASAGYGFPGHFDHNFNPSLRPPMTHQSYPMSPHSEASERASPVCPVPMPDNSSLQNQTSPSIGHSSGSRRDSTSLTQDPPRNNLNQIYCDHPECAAKPPVFSRKCEWTKHMDKHTRPYVCREPGCEKIRGFTYSGGLLRHEREVHRQHGGPKAPRFCPHKDCKRSTGQGFSRKENLNEHLRRVHRGVGIVDGKTEAASPQPPPSILPSQRIQDPPRKRRRGEMEDLEDDDQIKEIMPGASSAELRAEIKRLRLELAAKEESIQRMRAVLQMPLTHGQR